MWSVVAFVAPVAVHFGVIGSDPLRPHPDRQKTRLERLLFRNIWLIFVVNGALLAGASFCWHLNIAAAPVLLAAAVPTVIAQLACAGLASYWGSHDAGRDVNRPPGAKR
jgi:hypothetical protein